MIGRCLRKDPERRWQSMADVGAALQDLKDDLDSGSLMATSPAIGRRRRAWPVVAGLGVFIIAGTIAGFWWRGRPSSPDLPAASFTAVPLTTYAGREQQATFSPDGSSVAFSWNGEREENWDIYVKLIGPGLAAAADDRSGPGHQSCVVPGRSVDRVRAPPARSRNCHHRPIPRRARAKCARDASSRTGFRPAALVVARQPLRGRRRVAVG